jgi:hypothetical protein
MSVNWIIKFTYYITRNNSWNDDPDLNDRDSLEISPALRREAEDAAMQVYALTGIFIRQHLLFREQYFSLESRDAVLN